MGEVTGPFPFPFYRGENMEKKDKFLTWGLISKHRVSLMACAIVWVILHHGSKTGLEFPESAEVINILFRRGNAGVDMFLFLSGVGLYYSYRKKPNLCEFYKKRMMRVLLPYLFIGGGFWALADLFLKRDIVRFLKDVTLLSFWKDGIIRVWYIALILLLYAVFPAIWYFLYKNGSIKKHRLVLLLTAIVGINFLLFRYTPDWFDKVEIALTRIPVFVIGIGCAEKVWENQAIKMREAVFLIALLSLKIWMNLYEIKGVCIRYWYAVMAICVCILLCIVLELCERNAILCKLKDVLEPIGKWSLELYIVHVWVRTLLLKMDISYVVGGHNLNRYGLLRFGILLLVSGLVTWIAVIIEKRLFYNKK